MRAFIGIALPEGVRVALASLQHHLGESRADVKWVEPDNLHVTLKFLDEITGEQRGLVEALLGRVASGERAFALGLGHVGAFPSPKVPRVLWVGVEEGKETVVRIAAAIEREGAALSLRPEERPFAAHVTLGRVRSPNNRPRLAERLQHAAWQPPEPWRATSLTLYESVLSSTGPRYSVLAEIPLSNEERNQ